MKPKIYSKTHTKKEAFNDHLAKIKERGMAFRIKGMTIEYGAFPKSKDTTIRSTKVSELIKEAVEKGYKKVKVVFVKHKLTNFAESIRNTKFVKEIVGTQKTEILDVVEDASDIIELTKSKDVEKIFFV